MKKLMLAVAMVCAAVMSQASQAKWSVTNVQGSPSTAVAAGWAVCLYEGAASDFTYEAAKGGTLSLVDTAYTAAAGTMFNAGNNSGTTKTFEAGTTHSFYAVIYDAASIDAANYYIVSDNLEKTFNATGSAQSWAFGNMTATTTANKFKGASWTSTGAVPEPTSGLLLLLGVAGLALRRRRA